MQQRPCHSRPSPQRPDGGCGTDPGRIGRAGSAGGLVIASRSSRKRRGGYARPLGGLVTIPGAATSSAGREVDRIRDFILKHFKSREELEIVVDQLTPELPK